MIAPRPHVRNGLGSARPYVYARPSVHRLLQAFGAELVGSSPDGDEIEVRVDDAVIALAIGERFPAGVDHVSSIYVYVPDADATYAAALDAGGLEHYPPEDKPWQERQGAIRDEHGNTWYVATYTGIIA